MAGIGDAVLEVLEGPAAARAADLGTQLRADPGPLRARRSVMALLAAS